MKPQDLRPHLAGVATVAITPFDEDRRIDEHGLRAVLEYLDGGGTDTLVVGGGTGEFYALTVEERRRVVEVAAATVQRAPLVVSVGLDAVGAAEAARHAEDAGAAGIMIHQPVHPYTHPDGLRRYYEAICSAVSIGVVAYVRDARVGPDLLGDVLGHENVVGIKYAVNDVRRFSSLMRDTPHSATVEWICGTAEAWAPFYWVAGATGFTSGLANFAVEEALGMRDALRSGDVDRIRATWRRVAPVEELRSREDEANNIAVLKAGTCRLGLTTAVVRPPLRPLPAADDAELGAILEGWSTSPRAGAA